MLGSEPGEDGGDMKTYLDGVGAGAISVSYEEWQSGSNGVATADNDAEK